MPSKNISIASGLSLRPQGYVNFSVSLVMRAVRCSINIKKYIYTIAELLFKKNRLFTSGESR